MNGIDSAYINAQQIYFRIRTDYSNGTGKIGFYNIKFIPAKYYTNNSSNIPRLKINNEYITSGSFYEL